MEIRQSPKAIQSAIGKKLAKTARPVNQRLARWIVRDRRKATFLLLSTWPLWLVVGLSVWADFMPITVRTHAIWLVRANQYGRTLLLLIGLGVALDKANDRWKRLRR